MVTIKQVIVVSADLEDFSPIQTKNKRTRAIVGGISVVLVATLIFASGWAFGRGKISFTGIKNGKIASGGSLNYATVDEVYQALKDNYDGTLDDTKMIDGLKTGLANAAGDPYTEYFNVADTKSFNEQLTGSFQGIGAELGKDGANIVIIAPIAGSPAEKAGIKPKDIIAKIDDKTTDNMTTDQAVKLIRGNAGTNVKLTIVRGGALQEITITRAQITIPSTTWKIDGSIGILTISRFSEDTPQLVSQAADEFLSKNVTGIVLDLRSDPGGLLESAVKLSSYWLDEGKVVLNEKRGGVTQRTYKALGNPRFKGIKTVVLIDAGSASASEITAGALHDHGVATLLGEKSYGKGSVQQLLQLAGGATLKVTIARWYTPNDKNIDKQGIEPDKEVKQSEEDTKNKVDTQLQAALSALR